MSLSSIRSCRNVKVPVTDFSSDSLQIVASSVVNCGRVLFVILIEEKKRHLHVNLCEFLHRPMFQPVLSTGVTSYRF